MRFLHVSDLHIGKKLSQLSLAEDQQYILDQIVELAKEADCVLIAGDVFNRAQPSQESLSMAGRFFEQLALTRVPVAVIAGNHDSAELIGYCANVLKLGGIHAAGAYEGALQKMTLTDGSGDVDVWMMPFLRPANVRPHHPEAEIGGYPAAIKCVLDNAGIDWTRRNVLVAHQYVAGAAVCDSEELIVGGVDQIPASLFDGFDYVALGHLHTPQRVGMNDVRYSGSPLAYSLSEVRGEGGKCALMIDMDARGDVRVEKRELKPLRQLREVKGAFREIAAMPYSEDYVAVTLTDDVPPMDAMGALRVNFPNTLSLQWAGAAGEAEDIPVENVENVDPAEHFARFYRQQNGGRELTDAHWQVVRQLFEEVTDGEEGAR